MANFTPQEIEQFLQEFFDVVGARQYVGARYVPIFGRAGEDTVEWDDGAPYEPLTVVMHEGVSYVSRRYVPTGIQITDTAYWVETYRFNAQVEQYRQEVLQFDGRIDAVANDIEEEARAREDADAQVLERVANDYVPFPDSEHYPKYGTADQVLSTLTNGETKWVDPVIPDSETVGAYVEAWLDDHPEATTTVLDGAITTPKLADGAVTRAKLDDGESYLTMYPEHVTSSNYATHLASLDSARDNTIYKYTKTSNDANPTNLPSGVQAYNGVFIVTYVPIDENSGSPRKEQFVRDYDGFTTWHRYYNPVNTQWSAWATISDGMIGTANLADGAVTRAKIDDVETYLTMFPEHVTSSNYQTYLPTLGDARLNTAYVYTKTDSSNNPSDLPNVGAYDPLLLETIAAVHEGNNNPRRYQTLRRIRANEVWAREYSNGTGSWGAWTKRSDGWVSDANLAQTNSLLSRTNMLFDRLPNGYSPILQVERTQISNNRQYTLICASKCTYVVTMTNHDSTGGYIGFDVTYDGTAATNQTVYLNGNDSHTWSFASPKTDDVDVRLNVHNVNGRNVTLMVLASIRPRDVIVGQGQQFTSILEGVMHAIEVPHSHVLVKAGTYDIAAEILAHYGSDFLSQETVLYRGIPLGNFITVEFETGAVAELDLSDSTYSDFARTMVSIFNSGDSNEAYANTGFTLINADLVATNCRYCVHDEHGSVLDAYSNHYVNCRMHKNISMQYHIDGGYGGSNGVALGGGLGENGYITFDGCEFSRTVTSGQTTDIAWPVYYHTSMNSASSWSRIFVKNCIVDTTIRLNCIGPSEKTTEMYVTGCSLGSAPYKDGLTQGEIIAWNNEIRTP